MLICSDYYYLILKKPLVDRHVLRKVIVIAFPVVFGIHCICILCKQCFKIENGYFEVMRRTFPFSVSCLLIVRILVNEMCYVKTLNKINFVDLFRKVRSAQTCQTSKPK